METLYIELQILYEAYKCELPCTTIQIMEYAKKMDMFPNMSLAYKILLTISDNSRFHKKMFFEIVDIEIVSCKYHDLTKIKCISHFEYQESISTKS